MSAPATDVEAIVAAAGQGERLGLGPKAFVELAGVTLLERALATMLASAARVIVAVPPADVARAQRLVAGREVRVIAGGCRRNDTLRLLVGAASAPWLLLHDIAHPFVTTDLAQRVLDEARRSGAAAAVLANVDFLYGTTSALRVAPGGIVAIQKPLAFRRADIERGFAIADRDPAAGGGADLPARDLLGLAGRSVTHVPGYAMNFKLTTPDDYELARRLTAS